MRNMRRAERSEAGPKSGRSEVPGIVIMHGGWVAEAATGSVGLRAFVYGERQPTVPTLPFGRWKKAS